MSPCNSGKTPGFLAWLIVVIGVTVLCLGLGFGLVYGLTWLVVLTAGLFGADLPFWPTMAATVLGWFVLGILSGRLLR